MPFSPLLALAFPNIDPVALQLGPLAIRWYSLAYIGGIVIGWLLLARMNRAATTHVLSKQALDDLIIYAVIGIILGGRIGYVLFYQSPYYLQHPQEILYVWRGGMAFHGGLAGVLVAMWMFARRNAIAYFALMDRLAVVAPIGLFLGRIANFINGELYGRVTDVSWGMVFPGGGDLPRHPSQLYESALEGLVLFVVLALLAFRTRAFEKTGLLSGVFLVGYSIARTTVEQFREPDEQLGFLFGAFTMGQLLSLPMLGFGLYLIARAVKPQRA